MRHLPILSAVLLTLASHALAQVTLDLHALQALPERGGGRAPARTVPAAPQHPEPRTQTAAPGSATRPAESTGEIATAKEPSPGAASVPASPPGTSPGTPMGSASASTPSPTAPPALPRNEPQTALITPIAPPPASQQAPPLPPVSAKAATNAAPTESGLRVTFASGQADLSPESVAAIKQLTATAPPGDSGSFNVLAYAPGSPDDPSTARRVSLSRAMAVRSALIADGVPSARIYVRALGAQYGDGPPDRVDVNVQGATDSGTAAQATPR